MPPEVIPERVDRLLWKFFPDGIAPALRQEALVALARFGLEQSVVAPGTRVVDIKVGRNNVVVASKEYWFAQLRKGSGVTDEAFEPLQFVVELWAGLRVAIGQIKAADCDSVYVRFQVAAVRIV